MSTLTKAGKLGCKKYMKDLKWIFKLICRKQTDNAMAKHEQMDKRQPTGQIIKHTSVPDFHSQFYRKQKNEKHEPPPIKS